MLLFFWKKNLFFLKGMTTIMLWHTTTVVFHEKNLCKHIHNRTQVARFMMSIFSVLCIFYVFILVMEALTIHFLLSQVAMCNFKTIKDAADVAIATMLSGIQVCVFPAIFFLYKLQWPWCSGVVHLVSFVSCDMNVQALASARTLFSCSLPIYMSIYLVKLLQLANIYVLFSMTRFQE